MTKIDDQLISKLEQLSRLELSKDEKQKISSDLSGIVEMFDKLAEVDTDGVEPMRHVTDITNRHREDIVKGELSNERALKNVNTKVDGFIAVPKFLKPKK